MLSYLMCIIRVILIFRSHTREKTEHEKVRELHTRLHQHLIFCLYCACSLSLCLVVPLLLTDGRSFKRRRSWLHLYLSWWCSCWSLLGSRGMSRAATARSPPTHQHSSISWLAICPRCGKLQLYSGWDNPQYCTGKGISCTFYPQRTCTARFILLGLSICLFPHFLPLHCTCNKAAKSDTNGFSATLAWFYKWCVHCFQ